MFLFSIAGTGAVSTTIAVLNGAPWSRYYLLLWLASGVLLRAMLVGLWVSDRGVRVRNFWRTHTVAWEDLGGATIDLGGVLLADTIWILVRRKGVFVRVRTPITRGPARPVGLRMTGGRAGLAGRTVNPREFMAILRLLRERARPRTEPADSNPRPPQPSA